MASPAGTDAYSQGTPADRVRTWSRAPHCPPTRRRSPPTCRTTSTQDVAPALEFLSPVKGPSLEQITVAVGTGQTSPQQGAAQYDADVTKEAKQLGLPGW